MAETPTPAERPRSWSRPRDHSSAATQCNDRSWPDSADLTARQVGSYLRYTDRDANVVARQPVTRSPPRQAWPSATGANAPSDTTSRQVRGMRSLSFDVCGPDRLPQFLGIIGDELPELCGRCWKRGPTEVGSLDLQAPRWFPCWACQWCPGGVFLGAARPNQTVAS